MGLFFFGQGVNFDVTGTDPSHAGIDIDIQEPGTNTLASQIFLNGSWVASAQTIGGVGNSGTCINVSAQAVNWSLNFNGGELLNCSLDGIQINNDHANVTINGTRVQQNVRYGVNATVPTGNVQLIGVNWPTNGYLNGQNIANGNIANTNVYNKTTFLPWSGWVPGQTTYVGFGGPNQVSAYNDGSGGQLNLNGGTALNLGIGGGVYAQVGGGFGGITFNSPVRQATGTFGALVACNPGNRGTIAAIGDAAAPIMTWHQQVTAGGGSNYALVLCNGSGWFAIGY